MAAIGEMPMNPDTQPTEELSPIKRAFLALQDMQARLDAVERARREPIAVVGIGLRFPGGANDPAAFWQLLRDGIDAIRDVPRERWDVEAYYDPDPDAPGKMNIRCGGFLDDVDRFDPQFFGIAPREATSMDPQQRLLLEVTWEALEHAGQAPRELLGSQTGVFVAITSGDYAQLQRDAGGLAELDSYHASGVAHSIASGRLSYVLGLQGPSVSIDTACSSSLVAVHLACQSLRQGESNLALAGGVNLILTPDTTVTLSKLHMMAPGGRCRAFDAAGDGYVRGEGCAIVVLKRLSDALAAGDRILAVIRGSAANQDGASSGLTAPNGPAQEAVMRQALANSGVAPHEVSYVETHGTGTALGDPIEAGALAAVYGADRPADDPLMIGSVKTNVGHLEGVAGVASLIKTVLALQHGEIPPHLHLTRPNPHIPWDEIPVVVPTSRTPWNPSTGRRLAGVSSFGFSGTNVHLIVEEAPACEPAQPERERPLHLLALSARSEAALATLAERYADHLATHPDQPLADVCHTANAGRAHFAHRLAVAAADATALHARLAAARHGEAGPGIRLGTVRGVDRPKVAFLFTGQGSQYAGMGRGLYETQPTFRAALDRCATLLDGELERPLLEVLFPPAGEDGLLNRTDYTQPALFALEYALAALWRSWGIEPSAVMGHSVGELVAAQVAGVFGLEDALKLIAARGRLMQRLPSGGEMVALQASEDRVAPLLAPYAAQVALAAVNGPQQVVISGARDAVRAVAGQLEAEGVKATRLTVSHAFHSPLMGPMLDEFEQVAKTVNFAAPHLRLMSNVTGRVARAEVARPEYWRGHVRAPVRFAAAIARLHELGYELFLEIGPHPTLLGMGRDCVPAGNCVWLPSLRKGRDDWEQLLGSLGELYVRGVEPDWSGFDRDYPRRKVSLPTYPFERQRYWLAARPRPAAPAAPPASSATGEPAHPYLGRRLRSALPAVQFESQLSTTALSLLDDHRPFGTAILPGMVMLEMALSAANAALGPGPHAVEGLAIQEALVVPDDEVRACQTVLTPEADGALVQIFSQEPNGESWTAHASARVAPITGDAAPPAAADAIATIQARCPEQATADAHYAAFRAHRFEFGPSLQAVREVWSRDGEALGRLELPSPDGAGSSAFAIHPALLDAAAQLVYEANPTDDTYMPVGLERFGLYRQASDRAWAHVVLRPREAGGESLVADIRLLDDDGAVVAELTGLSHLRARPDAVFRKARSRLDNWLYEVAWQPAPRPPGLTRNDDAPGSWLIIADASGVGEALTRQLADHGQTCHVVTLGASFAALAPGRWQIAPAQPDHLRRLLRETRAGAAPLRGVVHLASLDTPADAALTAAELAAAQVRGCGAALALVRALVGEPGSPPTLWLVTRGAQPVGPATSPATAQAPLWGLGKVIGLEHPELRCLRVDLDPAEETESAAAALFAEIWAPDREDAVALRASSRYAPRLVPSAVRDAAGADRPPDEQPVRLEIAERGTLDNLALVPTARRAPGPGEVEIRVHASGLNFKDVLNALAMVPDTGLPLGMECAGTISAVGADVTDFQVGDAVVALTYGTFSTFLTVPAAFVLPKPRGLSFEEAATLPVAFVTAALALEHMGRMGPGDRVLIHAAAGGVGQAAVQLAQRAGAEIFATAGSPEKRAFLRSLGVQHVFDSRSLGFADEVMAATGGEGIDVVLNSLAGEFIPKSLALMRANGRFLELGQRDLLSAADVARLGRNLQYVVLDGTAITRSDPALVRAIFARIMAATDEGSIRPLPLRAFPLAEAPGAFRYMAQAKHIGKIVVVQPEAARAVPAAVRADATYLITGGLGALGQVVAEWLVEQGARSLVLVGRGAPSARAAATVERLRAAGARVTIAQADVSRAEAVEALLREIGRTLPPLRGIVHAAGVLDDGVLLRQDWDRFQKVLAPKVDGAWNLHAATAEQDLDFFVLFSSIASLFGSAGQGNYVAANAFLDALAHARRARGLPALSINWGIWSDHGLAAERGADVRAAGLGVESLSTEQGLQVLARVLPHAGPQLAVTPMRWPKYLQQYAASGVPPFLAAFADQARREATTAAPAAAPRFPARLAAAPVHVQRGLILEQVQALAGKVLELEPASLDNSLPLSEMGLDSLMAVELRNLLGAAVGAARPLPATLVFDYPTIEAIARYLADEVLAIGTTDDLAEGTEGPAASDPAAVAQAARDGETLVQSLADLSEDDVDRLFAERLRGGA